LCCCLAGLFSFATYKVAVFAGTSERSTDENDNLFLFAQRTSVAATRPRTSEFGFEPAAIQIQIFGGNYENSLFGLERPVLQRR
jgi:hypothetical protein